MSVTAALKKDCNKVEMRIVIRNGNPVTDENLRPWQKGWRRYKRFNTVGIFLDTNGVPINGNEYESQCDIPRASLVDYDGNTLTIYRAGLREMNAKEKAVWDEWEIYAQNPDYQRRRKYDLLTDCSSTFYEKQSFFRDREHEYLLGWKEKHGCKADLNEKDVCGRPLIRDNKIKGIISLKYEVRNVA